MRLRGAVRCRRGTKMNFRRYTPILVTLLAIVTTACVAQTWDANRDFRASNPNGAWSYGTGTTGTPFALYTVYNPDCDESGFVCWTVKIPEDYTPRVGFNSTGGWLNWRTVVQPPNVLNVHPGPYGDSIVQWKAPVAGYYTISGFFEILDIYPTGIIGLVFRNGRQLYRGELLGPPAQQPDKVGGREDFYFPMLFLNAGDVISFGVNADGDFHYDSTGFDVTIVMPSTR